MTIDQLITILSEQKRFLGGDAKVVAMWDCSLSDFDNYGIQNGALIFDIEAYSNSDLDKNFDYEKFCSDVRAREDV